MLKISKEREKMQNPKHPKNSDAPGNPASPVSEERRIVFHLSVKRSEFLSHLLYSYLGVYANDWTVVNKFHDEFKVDFENGLDAMTEYAEQMGEFSTRLNEVIAILREYKEYQDGND